MKTGFDFLKTRTEPVEELISSFENLYGIKLPPLFRLFLNTIDTGEDKFRIRMNNGRNLCRPAFAFKHPTTHEILLIPIAVLTSIEYLFEYWHSGMSDAWSKYQIMDIGCCWSGSFRIFVGIGDSNKDEIWVEDWDGSLAPEPIKFCDNIFEFVKKFVEEDMSFFEYGDEINRFYQK